MTEPDVDDLFPLVYQHLRSLAGRHSSAGRSPTLQPTALVHETYLKLARSDARWNDRAHFLAVAATAMRQILANHAEAKRAVKRGGGARQVPLDQISSPVNDRPVELVALDDALRRLAEADPRLARIVELCYFGGLTLDGASEVLGVSRSTVARGWRQARALLNSALSEAS